MKVCAKAGLDVPADEVDDRVFVDKVFVSDGKVPELNGYLVSSQTRS